MKFYLSSRLSNQKELIYQREIIKSKGHIVISRWLDIDRSTYPKDFRGSDKWYEFSKIRAKEDLEDIKLSDAIVIWPNENISDKKPNGGMYVEYGFAMGNNKLLYVIKPINYNIFLYHHPNIRQFKNWNEFISLI